MPDQVGHQQDAAVFQQGENPGKSPGPIRLVAHMVQHGGRHDDVELAFRQRSGPQIAFDARDLSGCH